MSESLHPVTVFLPLRWRDEEFGRRAAAADRSSGRSEVVDRNGYRQSIANE